MHNINVLPSRVKTEVIKSPVNMKSEENMPEKLQLNQSHEWLSAVSSISFKRKTTISGSDRCPLHRSGFAVPTSHSRSAL